MKNFNNLIFTLAFLAIPFLLCSQVTVNSAGKLTVTGNDIQVDDSFPWLYLNSTTTGNQGIYFETSGLTNSSLIYFPASDYFRLQSGNSNIYMLDNGNIGMGTSSPTGKLEVNGGIFVVDNTGSSLIRMKAAGTNEAQMTASADLLEIETYTGQIRIDANGGGNGIDFEVGSNVDAMRINGDGNVGIGTVSPADKLEVNGGSIRLNSGGAKFVRFYNGNTQTAFISGLANNNMQLNTENGGSIFVNSDNFINLNVNGANSLSTAMRLNSNGNVGIGTTAPAYKLQVAGDVDVTGELTSASDMRLKKDIERIPATAVEMVRKLNPVSYNFDREMYPEMNLAERTKYGLLAQEVEAVFPNLVSEGAEVTNAHGETIKVKSVNYMELIPVLVRCIQEMEEELAGYENLEKEVDLLRKELAELRSSR